jgi:hypothetical protein
VNGSSDSLRVHVLCPSYDDVPAFELLRKRVLEVTGEAPEMRDATVDFIVVDDTAGRDPEAKRLTLLPDVRVVTPPFNLGHQRAIVYGLRIVAPTFGDDDVVVTMDADGEDRPEDLPRLIAPLIDSGQSRSVCVARRTKRRESVRFRLMYFFFRIMFRVLTGTTVRNGNYAVYRGLLAKTMLLHPYFDLCYSSTLVSLDLAVIPVPCPRGERYAGRSRMSMLKLLMHGVRMLMPFVDRIAVRALVLFTGVFAAGLVASAALLGVRVFSNAAIPGWTSVTLLGVLGGSLVALGNFVVLFAVFSHSRGISLANLEHDVDRSA